MIEQVLDVFRNAQDAQSLGGVDHGRLGLAELSDRPAVSPVRRRSGPVSIAASSLAWIPSRVWRATRAGCSPTMILAAQVGCLLLFVAGDVKFGVRLQQRATIVAQLFAGKLLLDHPCVR